MTDASVANDTSNMIVESMLTTTDNPFDPFTQYDQWLAYDMALGHNTNGFLARIAIVADDATEADQRLAIELAINEIVTENVTGLYKKVSRYVPTPEGMAQWAYQVA